MLGKEFGSLKVIAEAEKHPASGRRWVVRCSCGAISTVQGASLRNGKTTSCGRCSHTTHGMSKTLTYSSWKGMIERCTAPASRDYHRYGGAGIEVCGRWRDFKNFFNDMGERPSSGHSLDRFPDKDGNYEPGNCRWATAKEQAMNTKSVQLISFNGVTDSIAGWAKSLGLSPQNMKKRLIKWPLSRAMTEAPRSK